VDARSLGIEVAATTSTGRRKINADAFLVDQAAGLFAVADGMGDEEGSALVARTALDAVRERFGPPWSHLPPADRTKDEAVERFLRGVVAANERAYELRRPEPPRIGTTFAGVAVCGDGLCLAHVGDSRVYLVRGATGKRARLTGDHTLLEELLRRAVPRGVAEAVRNANALTRAIGAKPAVEVQPFGARWTEGDVVVVCTDGVSDWVDAAAMEGVVARMSGVEEAASRLVAAAIAAGGWDNASVVVARKVCSAMQGIRSQRAQEGGPGDEKR
jgi:PPM family protein phosphatase